MHNIVKELTSLGLNSNQSKVYLAALKLGQASALDLSKESGVTRTTVYDNIRALKEYGLIIENLEEEKATFIAQHPKKLETLITQKEQIVTNLIPDLLEFYDLPKVKPRVKFFKGFKGIEEIHSLTLENNSEKLIRTIGNINSFFSRIPKEIFTQEYIEKRKKLGIKNLFIATNPIEEINKLGLFGIVKDKKNFREVRLAPRGLDFPLFQSNFGNKVALLSSSKEGFSMLIESNDFANSFKSSFDYFWGVSTPV